MIYTIGYQCLAVEALEAIVYGLNAGLLDCRAKPVSRKTGYGGRQLAQRFGSQYMALGHMLGGYGNTTDAGIHFLRTEHAGGNLLLLCQEESPGDCHRHHDICAPHFPGAIHIYRDELVTARELQRAIDQDDDYSLCGRLSDLIGEAHAA